MDQNEGSSREKGDSSELGPPVRLGSGGPCESTDKPSSLQFLPTLENTQRPPRNAVESTVVEERPSQTFAGEVPKGEEHRGPKGRVRMESVDLVEHNERSNADDDGGCGGGGEEELDVLERREDASLEEMQGDRMEPWATTTSCPWTPNKHSPPSPTNNLPEPDTEFTPQLTVNDDSGAPIADAWDAGEFLSKETTRPDSTEQEQKQALDESHEHERSASLHGFLCLLI